MFGRSAAPGRASFAGLVLAALMASAATPALAQPGDAGTAAESAEAPKGSLSPIAQRALRGAALATTWYSVAELVYQLSREGSTVERLADWAGMPFASDWWITNVAEREWVTRSVTAVEAFFRNRGLGERAAIVVVQFLFGIPFFLGLGAAIGAAWPRFTAYTRLAWLKAKALLASGGTAEVAESGRRYVPQSDAT